MYFTTDKGRIMRRYPQQEDCQDRYFEIYQNGRILFGWNAELENVIPVKVWNGVIRRYSCPFTTKEKARNFYNENRALFQCVVKGLSEKWNGNNYIGVLTSDAEQAELDLEYKLSQACDY